MRLALSAGLGGFLFGYDAGKCNLQVQIVIQPKFIFKCFSLDKLLKILYRTRIIIFLFQFWDPSVSGLYYVSIFMGL